ncbi:MAG TPA: phospholipase D-like domain-containing protein [Kofleriaceae bacterium]|nr:phospholipase D-like domain-containing protein [Kofleriaceae bacterium]
MELTLPDTLVRARDLEPYSAAPDALQRGHRLRLLVDGAETFPAMLAAIASARRFVHLETYILRADRTGRLFAGALIERARAGVQVRLMYDGFGAFPLPSSYLAELRRAGVETLEFRPVRGRRWTWRRWLRRDHRKVLVVDGRLGFVGGINIGDEYAPRVVGGKEWRDTHVQIEGPIVADLESMFRSTWHRAGGAPYPAHPPAARDAAALPGSELALALGSDDRGRRSEIRRHILHALARAQRHVYVASAYFLPDPGLRRALRAAARRGVDVRILLPAHSDVRSVQWAGEHTYARFLRSGVRIYQWIASHMHAKTIVIDDAWSMIGSYNLDYISLFWNMEVVVEVVGAPTAIRMREMFEADLARSAELTLDRWRRRRWWRRGLSWLFYRFRRFL